jgi:hypothetical protein
MKVHTVLLVFLILGIILVLFIEYNSVGLVGSSTFMETSL